MLSDTFLPLVLVGNRYSASPEDLCEVHRGWSDASDQIEAVFGPVPRRRSDTVCPRPRLSHGFMDRFHHKVTTGGYFVDQLPNELGADRSQLTRLLVHLGVCSPAVQNDERQMCAVLLDQVYGRVDHLVPDIVAIPEPLFGVPHGLPRESGVVVNNCNATAWHRLHDLLDILYGRSIGELEVAVPTSVDDALRSSGRSAVTLRFPNEVGVGE